MPWVNRQKLAKLQLHADKPGSNTLPQYILLTQEKVNVNEQIKIGKIKNATDSIPTLSFR
jgi:hypothetical protein